MIEGIGHVIQANAPIDQAALEKVVRATDSPKTSHTVLNNPGYAAHLKANVATRSHFYLRNYDAGSDADDWRMWDVQKYFNTYGPQVQGKGLGLQLCNEPGFGKDVLDALLAFMLEAERRGIPVSIGGFSVGTTPDNAPAWAVYDNFVQQLCRRPDLFTFDAHEYGMAVPTSGMVTNDTKPGEALYFARALLRKDQWPQSLAPVTNCYHIGRIRHLLAYAASKGYGKPTVDIGEGSIDFVGEGGGLIDQWGKKLPSTNPNKVIGHVRGYKSFGTYWPMAVAPGQSIQQTYMDMLTWVRTVVYDPLGVRSMRNYTWGNSGGGVEDWQDFDWNTDPEMQRVFLAAVAPEPVPAPTPEPKLPEFPRDFTSRAVRANFRAATMRVCIREQPTTASQVVSSLSSTRETALYIPTKDLRPEETVTEKVAGINASWLPILLDSGDAAGWIFGGAAVIEKLDDPPPPPVPPIPQIGDADVLYNQFFNIRVICDEALKQLEPYRKVK